MKTTTIINICLVIITIIALTITHCSSGTPTQGVKTFKVIGADGSTVARIVDTDYNIACYTYYGNASAISCAKF